jgi:methylamine dehydrogenase heavy chain
MHQGDVDTHKAPGHEVWVFDAATHRRVQRIALENPLVTFIGQQGGIARGGVARWALEKILPHPGVDAIAVTKDDAPVLIAGAAMPPTVSIYDARSGEALRDVSEVGIALSLITVP